MDGAPMELFRCPACHEFIGTARTQCSCGAPVDPRVAAYARTQRRIDLVFILPKLSILPVVFWAGTAGIYFYRRWVPAGFLALWPLIPMILLILVASVWPGPAIRGAERLYPKLPKARLVWKVSLSVWMLTIALPLILLFTVRPDLLDLAWKMLRWGFTHQLAPYPY